MLRQSIMLVLVLGWMAAASAVEIGEPAPAWNGTDFAGEAVNFPAVIDGKPTVMVFWATWCPYCNAFMPYLGEIQKEYGEDKINVIMINAKERGIGDPAAYVAALDFAVIDVAEGDGIAEDYLVRFIPGLMIIDGEGNFAWKRESTDLPAGKTVAELWDGQVRAQLDLMLAAK
jgi:thiol-disulfide isomerase/thioredoxin